MSTRMTTAERESFLAETHIGVLSVAGADGRAPMAVPIWYGYRPGGEITFATSPGSVKMTLIREAGQIGFTVQQEAMPYKYVSVEGSVVGYEPTDADEYRQWSMRYLGPRSGRAVLRRHQGLRADDGHRPRAARALADLRLRQEFSG
ncbi:pyridoxamine 5'-phosphate oxidase family protein [Nonomuraea dietziae]|uniref:pyridoxamine 5'-phosphate oxidase family protein n=1 Tax=Nonomuraea dietziae TaxID=65515 RepID=UPI0031DCD073